MTGFRHLTWMLIAAFGLVFSSTQSHAQKRPDADEPGRELPAARVTLVLRPERDGGERLAVRALRAQTGHGRQGTGETGFS